MNNSVTKLYRLLRPQLTPRVPALIGVLVLAAVAAFATRAPILLLEPLWSRVLFPGEVLPGAGAPGAPDGWFDALQQRTIDWIVGSEGVVEDRDRKLAALYTVTGLITALGVVAGAAQYLFTWLSRWLSQRLIVDLRQRLAQHLLGLSMRYHGQRGLGDLLSRISNDVTTTLNALMIMARDLTQEPMLIVASLFVAFQAAPVPTLIVLVFMPVVAAPMAVLGRKVRRRSSRSLASLGASLDALTEMFRGVRTVKAFRAEQRELERYRGMNEEYMANSMRMVRARAMISAATTGFSYIGLGVVLGIVGYYNLKHGFFANGGRMMEFFLAVGLVYSNMRRVARAVGVVQESAGAADRLHGLLDEHVDVVQAADPKPVTSLGSGVRFEDVRLRYPGAEQEALRGVTLDLRPGETLALVGPSGAGKTTLIDLVARFIDPTAGRVLVDGVDLRELDLDAWTEMFAMVGQQPFLFHTTVFENILYGRPDATRAEVEDAARAANMHEFIQSLPDGYDTLVGDDGAHLSGGQRQRITIARAILKGAPVLLLDEATSALDSESEIAVQEALNRLMEDRTVVVIAHRLSTVRESDRIACLEDGKLVELGTHDDLLARGGTYARLYAMQFDAGEEVSA